MPKRIQRKRVKGWRMPEGAVYVGRPTVFGNPFPVMVFGRQTLAIYEDWLSGKSDEWPEYETRRRVVLDALFGLRGKDLACWCKEGAPCHADVLLRLANGVAAPAAT